MHKTSLTPTRGPVGTYPQIFLKFSGLKIKSLRSIPSKGNPGKNFPGKCVRKIGTRMAIAKVLD
jgi:hypothetical protein